MKFWFNREAKAFNDVKKMVTRDLPVPGMADVKDRWMRIEAKRASGGHWRLRMCHNVSTVTEGLQDAEQAWKKAFFKHAGERVDNDSKQGWTQFVNFDTAFMVLRDMEEALHARSDVTPMPETLPKKDHFSVVYDMMPAAIRNGIDSLFEHRAKHTPPIIRRRDGFSGPG
ncbi:MAG: hypothetical protein OXT65_02660 [Alphaproteobacteria bacterium]|nr:hypothetical protein [Alphaproteobacteria bacterium]